MYILLHVNGKFDKGNLLNENFSNFLFIDACN